ncbi:SGNH/GDSL hydrolase family protein [Nocardioides sp. Y6]|uniref:SGNH/GDSL hydrolase family protein n=1 Tax=Nocardioides malaquae TaxID=2773426 RepID=A0ABR9RU73_9ACTN|nr:SGNH/GDSL hydrolase family protein [Nocardioides malaquae]MBE7325081.1 SGNH/GDSL hydrolase family protein [Nocardioides malaquae]
MTTRGSMTRRPRIGRTLATWGAALALVATAACSAGDGEGDAADAAPEPPASYVALGDSFTAAPFVPNLVEADGCYRSTANYPALVATELGVADFTDVSCSAADTTHMASPQRTATGGRAPAQFEALTEETELVTLGIGGNDFNVFGTLVEECPAVRPRAPRGAPCRTQLNRRSGDGDPLLSSLERTERRVQRVVEQIRERSPQARVLVVNYPHIVPAEGTCAALPLARGDYAYAREVATRLDAALRSVVEATDAELVDLWAASEGHDICSDDPWVNGRQTDFSAALEYHPFAAGQRAAADLVLEVLRGED